MKDNMAFNPTRDNVFARKVQNNLTTSFGIVLTESDESARAVVEAIGPDVASCADVKVGDTILLNWKHVTVVDTNGLVCVNINHVVAVIEE